LWELFKALVHDVSDIPIIKKMHYLKRSLKGGAAEHVAEIRMIPDDYSLAWEVLKVHYDNPRGLLAVYMKRFFDTPRLVNATSKDIDSVLNAER